MNIINRSLSLGAVTCASILSKAGLHAYTRHVPNIFGERAALSVGKGMFSVTGSELMTGQRPFLHKINPNPLDINLIENPPRAFPVLGKVLEDMKQTLARSGFSVSAIYFCKIDGNKYGDIINTSPFRSELLTTLFRGTQLIPLDIDMINGKIEDPWNISLFDISSVRYMGKIDPIVKRVSMLLGAKSYIVMLVRDDAGKVIGKVNIGVKEAARVPRDVLLALKDTADRIGKTPVPKVHLLSDFEDLVKKIETTPLWKFMPFLVLKGPGDVVSAITDLLDVYHTKREQVQSSILLLLAYAIEAREPYTYRHSVSVAEISDKLSDELFRELTEKAATAQGAADETQMRDLRELSRFFGRVFYIALLHDIGKIGTPDRILSKEGPLDEAEREEMDKHSQKGAKLLANLPDDDPLKSRLVTVLGHHHEDYDGLGVPDGLSAAMIPVLARIVRVADSYHAMTTSRPYREFNEKSHLFALTELVNNAGTQFDPDVVKALLKIAHDGLLPKEDYLVEQLKRRERAMEEALHGGKPDPAAKNALDLINGFVEKLCAGSSAEDLNKEIEDKEKRGVLPDGFVSAFNEAYVASDKIMGELKQKAGVYSDFLKAADGLNMFGAISDFIAASRKGRPGYTKDVGRKVINLFISKAFELWSSNSAAPYRLEDIYQIKTLAARGLANETPSEKTGNLQNALDCLFDILFSRFQA